MLSGDPARLDFKAPAPCPHAKQYAQLKRLLEQKRLLAKQPAYYVYKILFTLGLLALGLGFLVVIENVWLQLLDAAFLALVFCQMSFIAHDAGHRQIFDAPWKNDIIGLILGNLLVGLSFGNWMDSHNRHHANPNQREVDPDIDYSVLVFSEDEARRKQGWVRFIAKYQAYFFIPMLFFDALRRRKEAIQFLLHHKAKYRLAEGLLLAVHYALGLGLLIYLLGVWRALPFFLVHQALYGLFIVSAIAPNHQGMPILDKDTQLDFLPRQVLTSRNVKGHPVTDFWYGGLNYQIEHHLFPHMPRNNLRKAQKIVKSYCETHSITYCQTGAFQAYREMLQYLHKVSAPLRSDKEDERRRSL